MRMVKEILVLSIYIYMVGTIIYNKLNIQNFYMYAHNNQQHWAPFVTPATQNHVLGKAFLLYLKGRSHLLPQPPKTMSGEKLFCCI